MEFGALWIREWRDGVTHIIVDKDLCYDDVLKALRMSSLPVRILMSGLPDCPADKSVWRQACQRKLPSLLYHVSFSRGRNPAFAFGSGPQ